MPVDQQPHGIGSIINEINKEYQVKYDTTEQIINLGDTDATIEVQNSTVKPPSTVPNSLNWVERNTWTSGASSPNLCSLGVAGIGGHLYVVDGANSNVIALDTHEPTSPTNLTSSGYFTVGSNANLCAMYNWGFVCDPASYTVEEFGLGIPKELYWNSEKTDILNAKGEFTDGANGRNVGVVGGTNSSGNATLDILDATGLWSTSMFLASSLNPGEGNVQDVACTDNYAFIAAGNNLYAWNIADSQNPVSLGSFTDPDTIWGIDAHKSKVLISGQQSGDSNPQAWVLDATDSLSISTAKYQENRMDHPAFKDKIYSGAWNNTTDSDSYVQYAQRYPFYSGDSIWKSSFSPALDCVIVGRYVYVVGNSTDIVVFGG